MLEIERLLYLWYMHKHKPMTKKQLEDLVRELINEGARQIEELKRLGRGGVHFNICTKCGKKDFVREHEFRLCKTCEVIK